MKPPKSLVAAVALVIAFVVLGGSGRVAWAGRLCLPPAVGDAISPLAESQTLDHAMPPGWTLDGVNIWPERIELHTSAPGGANVLVQLDGAEDGAEGAGRSLHFHIVAGASKVTDSERKTLLAMAALVDSAIPADALAEGCKSTSPSHPVAQSGSIPRGVTVFTGLVEALVLFAAFAFVARSEYARPTPRPRRLGLAAQLALFAGALAGSYTLADPAPLLSVDTLSEQVGVNSCLERGMCTSLGFGTSSGGLFQGAAWLHMRILASVAGLGISSSLLLVHVLDAATLVLLARAAARHAGKRVGAFTAIGCVVGAHLVGGGMALSSGVALPFLGALLLVVAIEVVERPRPRAMVLLALVAAVAANVNAAGVLAAGSIGWIARRDRDRRATFLALGLGVFVAATFAIAPGAWIANARFAWSRLLELRSIAHEADPIRSTEATRTFLELLGGVVFAALLGRSRLRSGPSLAAAATAIAFPLLVAGVILSLLPSIGVDLRGVSLAMPATAALAAIAADGAIVFVLGEPWPSGQTAAVYASALGAGLVTTVATRPAGAIGSEGYEGSALVPLLTFPDVEPLPRELVSRGWSYAHVYRSLRSPAAGDVLASFAALASRYPVGPDGDDPTNAYFLKVDTAGLPERLPSGWSLLRRRRTSAALLILAPSALDWRSFEACDAAKGQCTPSGLRLGENEKPACPTCVKGMPSADEPGVKQLELRVPLLPAPPGSRWSIAMPRAANFCEGKVLGVDGRKADVSPDGRIASWTTPADGAAPGTVHILWELDSMTCPGSTYSGMPPFFLEGEGDTVGLLDDLLLR